VSYLPHTTADRETMLKNIGITDPAELFADVPNSVRLDRPLNIPGPFSEMELMQHMQTLAALNAHTGEYVSFLGGGVYDHYIPEVVNHLVSRSEFYTAYTPYQAEISQGTLQAIFEYQTMICQLTGMEVSNASMYDGASAAAEGVLMACDLTRRNRVLVARSVHPEYRETLATYLNPRGIEIDEIPLADGCCSMAGLATMLDQTVVAAVLVQHPNFFGHLEPVARIGELVQGAGAMYITVVDPLSLGLLQPPAEYGADIVVGDGQPLGNPMSFGGPHLGFLACTERSMRRLPGRLVGMTRDTQNRRGFVLTLQAREQHIRRDRATSNICSNQALCALAATIYLTALGPGGLRQVAEMCLQKASYAHQLLSGIHGVKPAFGQPFFKEFVLQLDHPPEEVITRLAQKGILAGVPIGRWYPEYTDHMLVAFTEKRTKSDIQRLVTELGGLA